MKAFSYHFNKSFWYNKGRRIQRASKDEWLEARKEARYLGSEMIVLQEFKNRPERIESLIKFTYGLKN